MQMVKSWVPIEKCMSQMTPVFMRKTILNQATKDMQFIKQSMRAWACLFVMTSGFLSQPRINTLKGAELIFYPTAIGNFKNGISADGDWHDAWKTVQRGHAITNGVHIAAVNRVGEEGQLKFWGGSFVCDSFGIVLKEASDEKDEVLVTKVDLSKNKEIQEGWGFLDNRRPDTYGALLDKKYLRRENEE